MGLSKMKLILPALFACLVLSGCLLEGDAGIGIDGINCWDTNGNGLDDDDEDANRDGAWDAKDCLGKQALTVQNPEVELNHVHFCEAFANLGQYPAGCPSAGHSTPTGTLKRQQALSASADGTYAISCVASPTPGPLSVKPKYGDYYFTVDNGFIARQTQMSLEEEFSTPGGACFDLCAGDAKCIASWASSDFTPVSGGYVCHLFYHSDTVSEWDHYCAGEIEICATGASFGVLSVNHRWSAMCP